MLQLRSWSGRYSADQMVGHKSAVRSVRLLPGHNLLATASLDRTVRLWDLQTGLPLASSRPHGGTVRCLALDPTLLASGCTDALVRLWHPAASPGPAPAPAPGPRSWDAPAACMPPSRSAPASGACAPGPVSPLPLYDVSAPPLLLRGHTGPVSWLALGEAPGGGAGRGGGGGGRSSSSSTVFSGSWDCTVRIWRRGGGEGRDDEDSDAVGGGSGGDADCSDGGGGTASSSSLSGSSGDEAAGVGVGGGTCSIRRGGAAAASAAAAAESGGWGCAGVLQYGDWVHCCAVRGQHLLVAAGTEVVVSDAASGRAVRRFSCLHDDSSIAGLEGCRSGRLLFTAAGDGLIMAHDLRMKHGSRVLWHHRAAVTGLAFEDPWLASSAADGCIILQDSEAALAGYGPSAPPVGGQRSLSASCRALHCPPGQPALCLDLADQWLAAGTDSGVVRLWDFTGAAAAAERASASRTARSTSKASRAATKQQHQQQQLLLRATPGAACPPPLDAPAALLAHQVPQPPGSGLLPGQGACPTAVPLPRRPQPWPLTQRRAGGLLPVHPHAPAGPAWASGGGDGSGPRPMACPSAGGGWPAALGAGGGAEWCGEAGPAQAAAAGGGVQRLGSAAGSPGSYAAAPEQQWRHQGHQRRRHQQQQSAANGGVWAARPASSVLPYSPADLLPPPQTVAPPPPMAPASRARGQQLQPAPVLQQQQQRSGAPTDGAREPAGGRGLQR